MADFDPYHEWLGISPENRPINYYSLFGLTCFESNIKAISNTADCKMAYIRTFQTGPHSNESQKILNELSQARVTLLNPEKKKEYDAQLRKEQQARHVPLPPPMPLLKQPEPVVQSVPKRPEPVVQSVPKRPEPVVQIAPKRPEPIVKPSPNQPKFSVQNFDPDDVQLRTALETYKYSFNPPWEVLKQILITEKNISIWKVRNEYGTQNYHTRYRKYTVTQFNLEDGVITFQNDYIFLGIFPENYGIGNVFLKSSEVILNNGTKVTYPLNSLGEFHIIISKAYSVSNSVQTKANVVDWVWEHAKKDGGKDLRYKKNSKIHILEYFKLEIYISNRKWESFLFSNERVARLFISALLQKDPFSIRFDTKPVTVKGKNDTVKSKNDKSIHSRDYMQEMREISRLKEGEFILRNDDDDDDDDVLFLQSTTSPISVGNNKELEDLITEDLLRLDSYEDNSFQSMSSIGNNSTIKPEEKFEIIVGIVGCCLSPIAFYFTLTFIFHLLYNIWDFINFVFFSNGT